MNILSITGEDCQVILEGKILIIYVGVCRPHWQTASS